MHLAVKMFLKRKAPLNRLRSLKQLMRSCLPVMRAQLNDKQGAVRHLYMPVLSHDVYL